MAIEVKRINRTIKVERVSRSINVTRKPKTFNIHAGGRRGEKGDTGAGVPDGGTSGQVLAKKTNANQDTEWVNQTGGSGMKIGNPVEDAQPNRALFTDENGDLIDDVVVSKFLSFFGGLLTGNGVRPTSFTHDDSLLLAGFDATTLGGFETFAVIQSKDRSGGLGYVKVDYNNLASVPPETIFLVGYDESTQKTSLFYYPNGQLTDPYPLLYMDEDGIKINDTQRFNEVVTTLSGATDEQLPTAKAVADAISAIDTNTYPPDFGADNMQSELQTLVANSAYAVVGSGYNYDLDGFSMDNPGDFGDGGFDIFTEVVPLWSQPHDDVDTVDFAEVFTIQDPSAWGGDLVEAATVMRGGRAFPYIELTSSESSDPYGEDPTMLVGNYSTPMLMSTRLRYQYDGDTGTLKTYRTARAGETADDTAFDLDWVEVVSTTKGTSWPVAPSTFPTWQVGKGGGKHLIARVIVHDYDGTPRADFNPANATDAHTVPDPITGDNWTSPTAYIIQTEDFLQKWLSSDSDIPDVPKLVDTSTTTVDITYEGSESTYGTEASTNLEYTGSPRVILSRFVMPEDGELDHIDVSMGIETAGSCKVRGAVYSNTAGAPDELIATGDETTITNTTNAYQEISFSGANRHRFSKGDILWIGVNPEDAAPRFCFGTVGSVTEGTWLSVGVTYTDPLPDPAPSFGYYVSGNLAVTITYKNAETGISVSTINESNLNADNSPTDGYVLTAKSSADGGLTWEASDGGSPGGSDTQVQFNDGGSFGGDAGLSYNKTTDVLTSGGHNLSGSTASRILATDASKNITALDTASYPSLSELGFVKGVTSAIQTQLDAKITSSSSNALTNKTIDANGTGNSITNLETADFAANVVDTSAVMAAESNTRLATQKAIKARSAIIQPQSGDYHSMGGLTSASASGIAGAGQIRFHPLWLGAGTIDRIAVSTSAAAVSTYRLGLYKADPTTGLPDGQTPFLDAGTVDMNASPGVLAITISQVIADAGLYWAAILCDAYTAQPTTHNVVYSSSSGGAILGLPQDMSSLGRYRVGRTYGSTVATGSLPTAPTSLMTWSGLVPRVAVRYV